MLYIARPITEDAMNYLGRGVEVKHEDIEKSFLDKLEEEGLEEGQDFEIVPLDQ